MRTCALTLIATNLAITVGAQVPNPTAPRLLNAKAIRCAFSTSATGTWNDATATATIRATKLSIAFTAIDTQDGTADAVGDTGKAHITVRAVGNYLTLMQMDPYGATYLTTVFNTQTSQGRFLAVHTRHEYTPVQLPGLTSRPEQYYGDCDVK